MRSMYARVTASSGCAVQITQDATELAASALNEVLHRLVQLAGNTCTQLALRHFPRRLQVATLAKIIDGPVDNSQSHRTPRVRRSRRTSPCTYVERQRTGRA